MMNKDKFLMWDIKKYRILDADTVGRMLVCRRCGVVIAQLDMNVPDCPVCELKKRFLNFKKEMEKRR